MPLSITKAIHLSESCQVKSNKTGRVDTADLKFFAENYLCGNIQQKIPGDFDGNGKVDFVDLNRLTNYWLSPCVGPVWCQGVDLNKSGRVDFVDFALFAENWLKQN